MPSSTLSPIISSATRASHIAASAASGTTTSETTTTPPMAGYSDMSRNRYLAPALRFQSDKRQLGGLLLVMGVTALTYPMAGIATSASATAVSGSDDPLMGEDGTFLDAGIIPSWAKLLSGLAILLMGLIAIPIGYLQVVQDYSHPILTTALIGVTQLGWIPFLMELIVVGQAITGTSDPSQAMFVMIPVDYDPSPMEVTIVGTMGVLGFVGYGIGFWGSFTLLECSLLAFQRGRPEDRPGTYYRRRLTIYASCNFLVGFSQLMLGVYIWKHFGNGPLPHGPISVAMYTINFPEISMFVGLLQCFVALYGLLRSIGFANRGGPDNISFQCFVLCQWITTVTLQILTQVAYSVAGNGEAAMQSQTMLTLGLNLIVAFLDYKARTVADIISDDYYGLPSSFTKVDIVYSSTSSPNRKKVQKELRFAGEDDEEENEDDFDSYSNSSRSTTSDDEPPTNRRLRLRQRMIPPTKQQPKPRPVEQPRTQPSTSLPPRQDAWKCDSMDVIIVARRDLDFSDDSSSNNDCMETRLEDHAC